MEVEVEVEVGAKLHEHVHNTGYIKRSEEDLTSRGFDYTHAPD